MTETKLDKPRGLRVRNLREFRNITQEQLADVIGCSLAAIQKIEKGGNTKFFLKLSKALECEIDWLEDGIGDPPWKIRFTSPRNHAPIIDWSNIIKFMLNQDFTLPKETLFIQIPSFYPPKPLSDTKHIFALRVKNDAMVGRTMAFFEQSIIFINYGLEPKSGDYVLIQDRQTNNEPIFRKLTIDGDIPIFTALNDNFPAVKGDGWRVLGVVFGESKIF